MNTANHRSFPIFFSKVPAAAGRVILILLMRFIASLNILSLSLLQNPRPKCIKNTSKPRCIKNKGITLEPVWLDLPKPRPSTIGWTLSTIHYQATINQTPWLNLHPCTCLCLAWKFSKRRSVPSQSSRVKGDTASINLKARHLLQHRHMARTAKTVPILRSPVTKKQVPSGKLT